jgi:hypothetical protein
MKQHDPYEPMLAELRAINDFTDDARFFEYLHGIQSSVCNLRQRYTGTYPSADYSNPDTSIAYLLAYYPYYIEPLYDIFSRLKGKGIAKFLNHPYLRVCFIGAGPAPESLGLAAFLQENCPETKTVLGYLLDKYVQSWRLGQELTRYHLAPQYWPNGNMVFRPVKFDFLDERFLDSPFAVRVMEQSHLFVIQNCLSDQVKNSVQSQEIVLRMFRLAQPNALFVICDLNFHLVRDLIRNIQNVVVSEGIGEVRLPIKDECDRIVSSVNLPQIVSDHLLVGTEGLIPKKQTKYYCSVMQRV